MVPANGNFDQANRDVLTKIDPSVDFSNFDYDEDGVVDFVFICWRAAASASNPSNPLSPFSGRSNLFASSPLQVDDGCRQVPGEKGATLNQGVSYRAPPTIFLVAAHEYGHDIRDQIVTDPIVPGHIWSAGPYCIMDGTGNGSAQGYLFSAWLRYKAGWVQPIDLLFTSAGQETTITLRDAAVNGDLGCARVRTSAMNWQYFFLEFRDSTSTTYTRGEWPGACDDQPGYTGLLIEHISDRGKAHVGGRQAVGGWEKEGGGASHGGGGETHRSGSPGPDCPGDRRPHPIPFRDVAESGDRRALRPSHASCLRRGG